MIKQLDIDFSNISISIPSMGYSKQASKRLRNTLLHLQSMLGSKQKHGGIRVVYQGHDIDLGPEFVPYLQNLIEPLSAGERVLVLSSKSLLSTQEAADYLGVSRPTLIKMLDEYSVEITLVGKHRRVTFEEITRLEQKILKEREHFLRQLASDDYKLGKLEGFDPVKNASR